MSLYLPFDRRGLGAGVLRARESKRDKQQGDNQSAHSFIRRLVQLRQCRTSRRFDLAAVTPRCGRRVRQRTQKLAMNPLRKGAKTIGRDSSPNYHTKIEDSDENPVRSFRLRGALNSR